jgi:hypothetical protein
MKSFQQHIDDEDSIETIEESSFLRGASSLALLNHIRTQRKKIKPSGKVDAKQLDALASMILASAVLTYTSTQFPPKSPKSQKGK